ERSRVDAVRRKLADALRYPAFLLLAAACVLTFFLMFVLPQFSAVLRDFGAKLDPVVATFLDLSDILRAHKVEIASGVALAVLGSWLVLRRPASRAALVSQLSRLPLIRPVLNFYRTG